MESKGLKSVVFELIYYRLNIYKDMYIRSLKSSIKPVSDLLSVPMLCTHTLWVPVLAVVVVDNFPHDQAHGDALLRPPLAAGRPLCLQTYL